MMRKVLTLCCLSLFVLSSFAQNLSVPNVSANMRSFRGVEAVEGLGYYCFAIDEKSKRGYRIFNLFIWDYDLNEIAKTEIEFAKKSWIIDAVYNGNNFLIAVYDSKKDNVRTIVFDQTGAITADKTADGIKTRFMMQEDYRPSFYADGSDGFYGIIPDKEPKFGFNIIRYDNNLDIIWRTSYFPKKGMQVVMDAKSDPDKLVMIKLSKSSAFTRTVDIDLTAFNRADGKESWSVDLNKRGKVLVPTELAFNKEGEVSVAGMYFNGTKIRGTNSDGIFFTHLDYNGDEVGHTAQDWKGELQRFLSKSKSGLVIGKPKVVFQDIIFDESTGQIKVIGELFSVNTAARVLGALSGDSNQETRIVMEDLVVFTFTRTGEFVDFYGVDKARVNIYLPASTAGGIYLTQALKQTGNLSYRFSSLNEKGEAVAFYIDFLKEKDGELVSARMAGFNVGKMGLGMLNLSNSTAEAPTVKYLPISKKAAKKDDKSSIEFDSKRSIINVTKSKPGVVLISELSKKTGNLNLFLETVDN